MTVLGIIFVLIVVLLALADPLLLSRFERLDENWTRGEEERLAVASLHD